MRETGGAPKFPVFSGFWGKWGRGKNRGAGGALVLNERKTTLDWCVSGRKNSGLDRAREVRRVNLSSPQKNHYRARITRAGNK
jgi:hypothetical protein